MEKEEEYNIDGCFNIIGASLEHIFTQAHKHTRQDVKDNYRFLHSKLISAWCDCSDNFSQSKLIGSYKKYMKLKQKEVAKNSQLNKYVEREEDKADIEFADKAEQAKWDNYYNSLI